MTKRARETAAAAEEYRLEIEKVLLENDREVRLKHAVDRLLESAAPAINNPTYRDADLWADWMTVHDTNPDTGPSNAERYEIYARWGGATEMLDQARENQGPPAECEDDDCEECNEPSTERINFPVLGLRDDDDDDDDDTCRCGVCLEQNEVYYRHFAYFGTAASTNRNAQLAQLGGEWVE